MLKLAIIKISHLIAKIIGVIELMSHHSFNFMVLFEPLQKD